MDAANTNLLAVKRRALELHKDSTENLDACELDYWHPVRRREWTAQTMAGVAFVMAEGGRGLDAAAALAIAEREHAEWRTAQLRPFAKRGAEFATQHDTTVAKDAHVAKAAARHLVVLGAVRRILAAEGAGRFRHAGGAKAGTPNATKLAKFYIGLQTASAPLGVRSVRKIIKKAVSEKLLA